MQQLHHPTEEQGVAGNRTLALVIIASILYPALLFLSIHILNIDTPVIHYLLTVVSSGILALIAFWALKKDGILLQEIGLTFKRFKNAVYIIALVWLVMGLIYRVIAGDAWLNQVASPLMVMQQWIFVGMAEELLFRGYLLNRLVRYFEKLPIVWARFASMGVSSLVFALFHTPVLLFNLVPAHQIMINLGLLFAMGIFFSLVYLRSGNLLLAGLVHGSWNVPLLGTQGDFLQLIIILGIIEIKNYVLRRQKK